MLLQVAEDIWRIDYPLTYMRIRLNARMVVIRKGDEIALYSPIEIPIPLAEEINKYGTVRWILAPNKMHHLFVEVAQKRFPEAKTLIAPGLEKKIKNFDDFLPNEALEDWFEQILIQGNPTFNEVILFHEPSKSLICADFIQHYEDSPHWFTRNYLKMAGILGKTGLSKLLRGTYKNKADARKSIDELIALDIDRIIPSHGTVIDGDGSRIIEEAYQFIPR